jgi:hypothetical protein
MRYKVELIVDGLLPLVDEGIGSKALAVVKVRSKWLEIKWQQTLTDVGMVSQCTMEAVKQWKAATPSITGLRKMLGLGARPAYQAMEKVYQIAGWYVGWCATSWGGSEGYKNKFSQNLFSFQFVLARFSIPYEIRDMLLQLEARSSSSYKAYSLNSFNRYLWARIRFPDETSLKEAAMKDVQQAIFGASDAIAQMIYCMADTHCIQKVIALLISECEILEDLTILGNLAEVKKWTLTWARMITSTGNAIWRIVETLDLLRLVMDKNEEDKVWSEIKEGAEKMFQFLYPYTYGIRKLYHHSDKAETNLQLFWNRKRFPYAGDMITKEDKKAIETARRIGYELKYELNEMFRCDDEYHDMAEKYLDQIGAQISHDWILFQTKFLELKTSTSFLFAPLANLSPQDMEQKAAERIKRAVLTAEQQIINAVSFIRKWPKYQKICLLNANHSLEILRELKNLVSDWSQAMSAARNAINEVVELLAATVIRSIKDNTKAQWILFCWDTSVKDIYKLYREILQAEENWQFLVTTQQTAVTDFFSLNSESNAEPVRKTGTSTRPSTTRHVDVCISIDPEQSTNPSFEELRPFITAEEEKAIIATQNLVKSAQEIWGVSLCRYYDGRRYYSSYLTGEYNDSAQHVIDSDGQIKQITRRRYHSHCISYDWMQFKAYLLNP